MNKKVVIVLLVVLGICCFGTLACLGTAFVAGGTVLTEGNKIISANLKPVCESHGKLSQTDYENYFATSFTSQYSLEEANTYIAEAFPETFDCNSLMAGNVIELFQKKMSIDIQADTTGTVANITYQVGEKTGSFVYEKEGEVWQISGIGIE